MPLEETSLGGKIGNPGSLNDFLYADGWILQ